MTKIQPPFHHTRTGAIALTAIVAVGISHNASAQGFLSNLFNKDKKNNPEEIATVSPPSAAPTGAAPAKPSKVTPRTVLSTGQLSAQESAASQVLTQAQAQEGAGNHSKAYSTYKNVVKSYPRTQSAAEAQYKMGEMRQAQGNDKKAFEEYQELITVYKNSKRFTDALNRQFAIADKLKNSQKKGFGGIGASIQPSRLIEMFQQIANSAPYTNFAPRALINIGDIHSTQGEFPAAIMAYQQVANSYQTSSHASDAQHKIFNLRGKMAKNSFSPVADRAQEEAGLDFVGKNPGDKRASDVKAQLGEIEDRKLEKLFNVGRFYESQKQPKSAVIYYREIVKHPGSSRFNDAKQRIAEIESNDPGIAASGQNRKKILPIQLPSTETQTEAPKNNGGGGLKKIFSGLGKKNNVSEEASYLGPPPPTIATKKPTMRTSSDDLIPIPNDDPISGN